MFNLSKIKNIMVFGAHPDDEIIGLGATIHNLSSQKKEINVITFTGGGTAANSAKEIYSMIKTRKNEMKKTNKILLFFPSVADNAEITKSIIYF